MGLQRLQRRESRSQSTFPAKWRASARDPPCPTPGAGRQRADGVRAQARSRYLLCSAIMVCLLGHTAVQTYVAEGFLAVEATRQGSALPLLRCIFKFSSQDRILQCTVEQISRDADRTDLRVPRQKPAADSRTDLRHPSAAGLKGTRGGLHGGGRAKDSQSLMPVTIQMLLEAHERQKNSRRPVVSCSLSSVLSRVRRISKCTESSW